MFRLLLDRHQVHKQLKYTTLQRCIFQLFVDLMMVE